MSKSYIWVRCLNTKHLSYVSRINVDNKQLYPCVEYPVPVGTPLISPLVQWDHTQTWDVPKAEDFPAGSGGSTSATIYNIGERHTVPVKSLDTYSFKGFSLFLLFSTL
jgi:fatty acid synthase